MTIERAPVFTVVTGSTLYGLTTPESDIDYGNVYLESKNVIFGHSPTRPKLSQTVTEERDDNNHWVRDFAHLCAKGNPNAIEWLWAPSDKVVLVDKFFQRYILKNSEMFIGLEGLSKSHFGFAISQLHRIKDISGKVGKARRDMVDKYGYNVKFASHSIRLMFQLMELVENGRMTYPFSGEKQSILLAIKTGKMTEQEVVDLFNSLRIECDEKIKKNKAGLPPYPDLAKIDENLIFFFEDAYYG